MRRDLVYHASTDEIIVKVQPEFLEEESDPFDHKYFWAYHVRIENSSDETVQILNRHWQIINGFGASEEVHGSGIVGEHPVLQPGEAYEYTSAAPLNTPSGMMLGTYDMATGEGKLLSVNIPVFSLDSPYQSTVLN